MATKRSAGWITWVVLGLAVVVIGGAVLLCMGFGGLGMLAMSNGQQYDVARIATDECEAVVLFRADDDKGVDAMFAELFIAMQEKDQGRKLSARERQDQARAAEWMVPRSAAFCVFEDDDTWTFAINPETMGRMFGWIFSQIANSSGTPTEIEGYTFAEAEVVFGSVDGTIVAASSREVAEPAVKALIAETAPESALRTRAEAAIEGSDFVLAGIVDGDHLTAHLDVVSKSEGTWATTIEPVGSELDLEAEAEVFCQELRTAATPATVTCEARIEDGKVVAQGKIVDLDVWLTQKMDDDEPPSIPVLQDEPEGASGAPRGE